jgi:hypothetical protein
MREKIPNVWATHLPLLNRKMQLSAVVEPFGAAHRTVTHACTGSPDSGQVQLASGYDFFDRGKNSPRVIAQSTFGSDSPVRRLRSALGEAGSLTVFVLDFEHRLNFAISRGDPRHSGKEKWTGHSWKGWIQTSNFSIGENRKNPATF